MTKKKAPSRRRPQYMITMPEALMARIKRAAAKEAIPASHLIQRVMSEHLGGGLSDKGESRS